MLKRFRDSELRPRIAREIEEAIEARILTPENIDVPSTQHKFTDYMREMNAGAGETMIRILEKGNPSAIMKFGAEADLVVGNNEPYAVSDETDYTIPVHGEARGLINSGIEIRQDLIADHTGQQEWAERLTRVLGELEPLLGLHLPRMH